jgi:hypothetical protein
METRDVFASEVQFEWNFLLAAMAYPLRPFAEVIGKAIKLIKNQVSLTRRLRHRITS